MMSIHVDLLARNMDRGMSIQRGTNDWNTILELAHYYISFNLGERPLNLQVGKNIRDGKTHIEFFAPCGCSYHPEGDQGPHIHPCKEHKGDETS